MMDGLNARRLMNAAECNPDIFPKLLAKITQLLVEKRDAECALASEKVTTKKMAAVVNAHNEYIRPAHLARLTIFTYEAAKHDRTEAARMILRRIEPQFASGELPPALEKLAVRAAKDYPEAAMAHARHSAVTDDDSNLDIF